MAKFIPSCSVSAPSPTRRAKSAITWAYFADIRKLKASERLEFLAHHDPLTKLPNRMLLMSRLQHSLDTVKRKHDKPQIAVPAGLGQIQGRQRQLWS